MLVPLSNTPKGYAWGSRSLIANLEGRVPTGEPEAEMWFGDHPAGPARTPDGTPLDEWLARGQEGAPERLPYLLKLLAAGAPLSIQAHPSKEQAEAGFAREAHLPLDAPDRNYRDDNHKPELLLALSDTFQALCGLRPLDDTRRLLDALGDGVGVRALRDRLDAAPDDETALRDVVGWLLSGQAQAEVSSIIGALHEARSIEFAPALAAARRIVTRYPDDPGVVVALLMNHVVLRRGEALFVRAGMLHAYLQGLGVEVMATSDNVLRGGLTRKHIDVPELLSVLDARPAPVPVVLPRSAEGATRGVEAFAPGIPDFELLRARVNGSGDAEVRLRGAAVALATDGEVRVEGRAGSVALTPGKAALITLDESPVRITGHGEVVLAQPGA